MRKKGGRFASAGRASDRKTSLEERRAKKGGRVSKRAPPRYCETGEKGYANDSGPLPQKAQGGGRALTRRGVVQRELEKKKNIVAARRQAVS